MQTCRVPDVRICAVSNLMDFRCCADIAVFTCGMNTEVSDLLWVCNRFETDTESFLGRLFSVNKIAMNREERFVES
jgi:hypothetical protein